MKVRLITIALIAGLGSAAGAYAEAPTGATGECKDGTYSDASSKRGACSGHGGVKTWYGKQSAATKAGPAPAAGAPTAAAAAPPAAAPAAAKGAQAAPAGATGVCKDGTSTDAPSKRGACSGHGGVKTWYGTPAGAATSTPAPAAAAPATPTAAPAAAAAPPAAAAAAAPTKAQTTPAAKSTGTPTQAAAGGGPGKVWVNAPSKVYHCPGDRWYGKTKEGEYMSEADAKAKGNRPASGKACS